jgi:hypothetical protein
MDHLIGNSWLWSAVSDALPPIEEEKVPQSEEEMPPISEKPTSPQKVIATCMTLIHNLL